MRLALSKEDCARLGCPEAMPADMSKLTNREAIALQEFGIESIAVLGQRLRTLSESGHPTDYAAWDAFLWLILRREGIHVDVHTFEYDMLGMRLLDDEEVVPLPGPPASPGKAEGLDGSTNSPRMSSIRTRTSRTRSPRTG